MAARLKERYTKEVLPKLKEQYAIENVMAVPRLEKVVINLSLIHI